MHLSKSLGGIAAVALFCLALAGCRGGGASAASRRAVPPPPRDLIEKSYQGGGKPGAKPRPGAPAPPSR